MSSSAPAKSQPLHNFTLPPLLGWNKDGKSGGSHKRSRSMKSPLQQRPNAASASPPCYSPLRDYVTPTSPLSQEYPEPPSPDSPVIGGDSVEEATVCEGMKQLAVGGGDSEKLSFLREEALRYSRGGDREPESEASRKGKGAAIEHHRNQFKKSAFGHLTKGVCSSNSEEGKFERECKATEGSSTAAGIKKKSNVSIKIACKNSKEEEEKTEINEEHGGNDEEEKEGKTNNNSGEDIKLWNLRPRNVKSKLDKAKVGGEVSGKNKGEPPLKSCANKSRGKGGKGGGEKKEKCGKLDKSEDKERLGEKSEKKKLSISIALSKEEIEEDIFALTGSKPSRRPKRRVKNVQKELDVRN